jgi:hypothetical protein
MSAPMTASLELSIELFKLSGWGGDYPDDHISDWWTRFEGKTTGSQWTEIYEEFGNHDPYDNRRPTATTHRINRIAPAYSSDYLLLKLPQKLSHHENGLVHEYATPYLMKHREGKDVTKNYWTAGYDWPSGNGLTQVADTPADALTKLAIQLIQDKVIIVGENHGDSE